MRTLATAPAAILLVADDRDLRTRIADALTGGGMRVTAVGTRAPVITAVGAMAGFDAAILDVPPADGAAVAIASQLLGGGETPLVLLAAAGSSVLPGEEQAVAHVTQLSRPVEPAQLLQVILGVVKTGREQRRLRSENEQLARAVGQARDINVVVGILMERFQVDRNSAFEALRRQARARRMKLADFAHSLVGAEERLQAFGAKLTGPRAGP